MTAYERLIAAYPYKTELHTHTSPVSACSHMTAREHRFPVSGGSDCHEPQAVGTCLARTERPLMDSFDIARAIKERDLIFDLSGHLILPPSIS